MTLPNLKCATAVRDGGIDAMAALDTALREAISDISLEDATELKRKFGQAMGEIVEQVINPALKSFPELTPDESTWREVAKARASARANGTCHR